MTFPSPATLQCYGCHEVKPLGEFSPSQRKVGDSKHRYCRPCRSKEREARGRIPRLTRRRWALKSNYGITPEDFEAMMAAQNGQCAICERDITTRFHLDHDHVTNKVRGILCPGCNTKLPQIEDAKLLEASLRYLQKHT